ncbi:hypothetical protein ACIREO_22965 [Streptomyces sp. NPDC102441]|uniref:hypothetical protein n=1 Tax=Streptomyces sp. NPDC102441 TaxID=3366176 RepID=UPI0037F84914
MAQQQCSRRRRLNDTLRAHGALHVGLYALVPPAQDPHDNLAACQGHAELQGLVVMERIAAISTTRADDPALRRGYARLLSNLADPAVPLHGVVAADRNTITTPDQLTWFAAHRAGLWPGESETGL